MFRASFLRSSLESLQRVSGGKAQEQLLSRFPENLRRMLTSQVLKRHGSEILLSLDDVEEFLLGIDIALGDGSGSVLESVGQELATRSYLEKEGVLGSGSVRRTVERLGDMLLRPFENAQTHFRVLRTDTGFNLALGVQGRPRATRALRHLATGCIRAAFTFALEATSANLKLYAHTVGDRAEISARYREPADAAEATPPPSSRHRSLPSQRPSTTRSVAREVERILSSVPKGRASAPVPRLSAIQELNDMQRIPGPPLVPQIAGTKYK